MAYFPFYVELADKKGLIVGGGRTAAHKIAKLKPFGPTLTVVAEKIDPDIRKDPTLCCVEDRFDESYLESVDFVIAATDDKPLNRRIFDLCQDRRILVNSVDDKESCGFIFPALISRGRLTVGISTGGASPTAAAALKNQIEELLPEKLPEILAFLDESRPIVRGMFKEEGRRSACFKELYRLCIEKGGPLSEEELRMALNRSAE